MTTTAARKKKEESIGYFDFSPHTRLVFGNGSSERIGELTAELGGKRVLLVTDAGLVAAGHAKNIRSCLEKCGLVVTVFDRVKENPTTACVDACVRLAEKAKIDFLVGLGGGSSMDTAKGCNFIYTNGGRMEDYWGLGKAKKPMLPLIAIPTTAGTGSECQSVTLIAKKSSHQKMACGDIKAAPRIALLDPTLTLSQPFRVTAVTGIDALSHAIESAVTTKRTAISWLFSKEAFALCARNLALVLRDGENLEARGQMLLGASLAGCAIENSMLGAAHSTANPLTAHFDVVHGHAVGLMLPHIIRFNSDRPEVNQIYAELAELLNRGNRAPVKKRSAHAGEFLAAFVEDQLKNANLPTRLRDLKIAQKSLPTLAEEAALQWTARFNPRPLNRSDFLSLYELAY